jgi:hypothetical protein|tara:strand:- start:256 stop:537 length:282 start_codon:yes stop_codon:yes gene_type:complete
MQGMVSKLSSYAALLGVIGGIGAGFMAFGEFNNRIAQLEDREYVISSEVDLTDVNKSIEGNKADIKINGKAIEYLEAKIREVQVANDNPLLSN